MRNLYQFLQANEQDKIVLIIGNLSQRLTHKQSLGLAAKMVQTNSVIPYILPREYDHDVVIQLLPVT